MSRVAHIRLHGPNSPHQRRFFKSGARYKVGRWGRRAGKSVAAFDMAVGRHGPNLSANMGTEKPHWQGIVQGYDVIWIARSYKQANAIWSSEVRPKFESAGGTLNDTKLIATLPGMGSLIVCSQERDSINNARGLGSNIIGVIGDEVAHWDHAEEVWLEILVPMLADNRAWAIFISTTEPGSWFNNLCKAIEAGEKSADWYHSYATALDNPRITRQAFDEMVEEYPANDPRLQKEVYALLTLAGGGLAFPEWRQDIHCRSFKVPNDWRWIAGMDWGYTSPGSIVFGACGDQQRIHWAHEYTFDHQEPIDVGRMAGTLIRDNGLPVEWIAGDNQMWFTTQGSQTIAEGVQAGLNEVLQRQRVPLIEAPKGPGSRLTRKTLMHTGLKIPLDPDGNPTDWGGPDWTFDPIGCPNVVKTIPELELETKKLDGEDIITELVKKNGREHWFDALTYCAISRAPHIVPKARPVPEHVHPGWTEDMRRKPREVTPEWEAGEYLRRLASQGQAYGGRYGGRQRI